MTDMEIETFLTVLRCGSMTAAAQALYITQPTLSARLQTLEDEVGTPLFVRGKGLRRLELTDAGSRFLPLAQRWRKLTDEMRGIAARRGPDPFPHRRGVYRQPICAAAGIQAVSGAGSAGGAAGGDPVQPAGPGDCHPPGAGYGHRGGRRGLQPGASGDAPVPGVLLYDLLRGQRLSGAGGPPGPWTCLRRSTCPSGGRCRCGTTIGSAPPPGLC